MTATVEAPQKYVGQPLRRREDPKLMTGAGRFLDDIKLPGMTYAAVLRSPVAHANIRSIDTSRAKAMPGVVGVFTGEDLAEAVAVAVGAGGDHQVDAGGLGLSLGDGAAEGALEVAQRHPPELLGGDRRGRVVRRLDPGGVALDEAGEEGLGGAPEGPLVEDARICPFDQVIEPWDLGEVAEAEGEVADLQLPVGGDQVAGVDADVRRLAEEEEEEALALGVEVEDAAAIEALEIGGHLGDHAVEHAMPGGEEAREIAEGERLAGEGAEEREIAEVELGRGIDRREGDLDPGLPAAEADDQRADGGGEDQAGLRGPGLDLLAAREMLVAESDRLMGEILELDADPSAALSTDEQ